MKWWAEEGWLNCKGKSGNWDGVGGRDTDEVFVDGAPLREVPGMPGKPGQFSFDHDSMTVYVWLADSADPKKRTVEAIRRGHCIWIRGSHIRLEGFTLRHAALNHVQIRGGDHNVVANNTITYAAASCGIHLTRGADHNRVSKNRITHVGYAGIQISRNSNHTTIEDNEIAHIYSDGVTVQNGFPGGVGHQFIRNTIHHVINEDGIDIKCGRGHIVRGNIIYKCSNLGVQIFNHHGSNEIQFEHYRNNKALIEDNRIFDNGGGGILVYEGEYLIRNNVLYGNGHEEPYGDYWGGRMRKKPGGFAIEIGPCFYIKGTPLTQRIYNNTCFKNARGELWIGGSWAADPLHCEIKNNILVGGPNGVLLKTGQIGVKHLVADYNLIWPAKGGAFTEWNCARDKSKSSTASSLTHVGTKYHTFEEYRNVIGLDKHSVHSEPDFVNSAAHDFSLQPDSPGYHAGTDVGLPFKGKAPTTIGASGDVLATSRQ